MKTKTDKLALLEEVCDFWQNTASSKCSKKTGGLICTALELHNPPFREVRCVSAWGVHLVGELQDLVYEDGNWTGKSLSKAGEMKRDKIKELIEIEVL